MKLKADGSGDYEYFCGAVLIDDETALTGMKPVFFFIHMISIYDLKRVFI